MGYEWDPDKAASNLAKHGVDFADAVGVLEDEFAAWQEDIGDYGEERYVAIGQDYLGRILTVVFTIREETIRLISARMATPTERKYYGQFRE